MFENLTQKLQSIFRRLGNQGILTEKHLGEGLREIRLALLEADVNYQVAKDFVEGIQQTARGAEIMKRLTPSQHLLKIVRDELEILLGSHAEAPPFAEGVQSIILLTGLQGSGKTTSCGKLGLWLKKQGRTPLLVPVDVRRPAAIEQLQVVGRETKLMVFDTDRNCKPEEICRSAIDEAAHEGHDVVLIDTGGRLHIDDELMDELEAISLAISPDEVLFVADAMTGQDAVKSANAFHGRLNLTGIILTKMDGDARGGAALSMTAVTQKPIRFTGTGEAYDALELFHPERMAARILGMGDLLTLIEKAEEEVDREETEAFAQRLSREQFTLEDFLSQLRQIQRLGPLESILELIPGFSQVGPFDIDEQRLRHVEAIISSMTKAERMNHKIIDGSRKRRIAKGCGRPIAEVNRLLKQFYQMQKMMKSLHRGPAKKLMRQFLGKMPVSSH